MRDKLIEGSSENDPITIPFNDLTELLRLFERLDELETLNHEFPLDVKFVPGYGESRIEVTQKVDVSAAGGNADWRNELGDSVFFSVQPSEEIKFRIDFSDIEISDQLIDERLKLLTADENLGFLPQAKLAGLGTSGNYELVEDYSYEVDYFAIQRPLPECNPQIGTNGATARVPILCSIKAPKGFQFDRASIPRLFWVIISKDDLSNVPPLFHDLLYRYGGRLPDDLVEPYTTFVRREADFLFRHLMDRTGVKKWRRDLAFQAVRQLGSFAWAGSADNNRASILGLD